MKRIFLILLLLVPLSFAFADDSSKADSGNSEVNLNPVTGFPEIEEKPFVIFNEGATYALVTRLEKQENRSNFVYEDHLLGLFFSIQTENMHPLNSLVKLSVYYPFAHEFNDVPQTAKQVILYAADLFAGPMIQTDMWKYVRISASIGLHYMYQLSDEYHLHYLGAGLLAGLELPLASYWTILANGTFTFDYPNFGSNAKVQPFDFSWQYHFDLGVRFSKKAANEFSYIGSRKKN
ncbi:MAG: hypothetical protein II114_00560 [Treponema sp.]|nr:hypothetical protein [Treponema sp.]